MLNNMNDDTQVIDLPEESPADTQEILEIVVHN